MEITIQRQSIVYRPMGVLLIALGIVVLWTIFPGNPAVLALIAISIIFIIGLKKPLWAVAAFLISQFTIPSYYAGPISLRLLLLILTGILLWRAHTQEKIQLGKNAKRVIIPIIVLIVISFLANLINSGFDFAYKDFRNYIGGLLIIIFIPAAVRNVKDLKLLCGVALIGLTASAIIAIMQHYNILGMAQELVLPGRVQGLSENELELSYILSVVLMTVLGVLLYNGIKTRNRRLLIPLIMMLAAIYFTYTRSALTAILFGLVALLLFSKTRIKSEIIIVVLLAATLYLSVSGIADNFSFSARDPIGQEASSIERKILWQAGIAIAIDNPVLGIGGDRYAIVNPQYVESVDPALIKYEEDRYYSYRTLGGVSIHNDFLNMWVSYGIGALITFLWIILVVLSNCINSFRVSKQRFVKGLAIGLATGLVAYTVNAFYHNLLAVIPLFWMIAGFSVAVAKLATENNGQANGIKAPAEVKSQKID
jgi:O-antigen ligase